MPIRSGSRRIPYARYFPGSGPLPGRPGSPALAVGLTSTDLGLHREVGCLCGRLVDGRRRRDVLEIDARRVRRPVAEEQLDLLRGAIGVRFLGIEGSPCELIVGFRRPAPEP